MNDALTDSERLDRLERALVQLARGVASTAAPEQYFATRPHLREIWAEVEEARGRTRS